MRPEKSLGQHFLRDPEVLADIAAVADVGRADGVLEIGPGEGALTAFLVESRGPVVAIDKDPRARDAVSARFGERVHFLVGDAAEADLAELLPEGRAVIVGNLPYNVASAIHRRVLGLGARIARAVLMFQHEVAERIVAGPGSRDYGVPSVMTAVRMKAWIVREVGPEAFFPPPKVRSAVVLLEPLAAPLIADGEIEAFGAFVSEAFRLRRKTLGNALPTRREALVEARIDPLRRVESLTVDEIVRLYRVATESL